jgi:hypothetical protein
VADYEFPADLLDLQRRFLEADARCGELSSRLPSATELVASGTSASDYPDYPGLQEARAKRLKLALELARHEWLAEHPDRVEAKKALRKAAQAMLDEASA